MSVFFLHDGTAGWLLGVTSAAAMTMEAVDLRTRRKPTDRVDDRGTGLVFTVAMIAAIGGSVAAAFGLPPTRLPGGWLAFSAGLVLVWVGLGLNRWARRVLGQAYRPVVTLIEGQRLVTKGPYRAVRHPMYAGGMLMCVGVGVLMGTWLGLVLWLLPPAAMIRRINVEERVLAENLAGYPGFRDSRARLVPGLW
jgi:protein-S-isoprenylcysteine O-methyltransferase Ste14